MIRRILALIAIVALTGAVFTLTPSVELISGNPVSPTKVEVKARDLALVCPGAKG